MCTWPGVIRDGLPPANFAAVSVNSFHDLSDRLVAAHCVSRVRKLSSQQVLFNVLAEPYHCRLEGARSDQPDLPDVELDKAHDQHVIGEEGELVFAILNIGVERLPEKADVTKTSQTVART